MSGSGGIGLRVGIRGNYKRVAVPMDDGRLLRFRVYEDGTVYELLRVGQRRVTQEPFATELFEVAWGEVREGSERSGVVSCPSP